MICQWKEKGEKLPPLFSGREGKSRRPMWKKGGGEGKEARYQLYPEGEKREGKNFLRTH